MEYAARKHYVGLHDLEKYRVSTAPGTAVPFGTRGEIVGGQRRTLDKYRHTAESFRLGGALLGPALRMARNNANLIFEFGESGTSGVLYDIQTSMAPTTEYEDVEDGFTERRENYDESTITLQELAEQVKTLRRDFARAGLLR